MTRSNGIDDDPFHGVDSLASAASSPLGVRKEDPLPEHDIVPGQFDDAEPQDHDFNHNVSGNEATLFPDLATSAPSTTDATSKPSDHVRDIVLGFKSGTKTSSGEMKGTANAAPSPAERLAAERQLLSPAFPTRTNTDNQRFRIPQQPRRNPAHQNLPYGQPYVDIKPKPSLGTKKYVGQQCIAVSATNPHAPPFIWSYSPNKRQRVKQPFARLNELDQHPHPLLLPAGVAPLLQKHGHFVAPADGSTGFPLHNFVDPDPVTRILAPTSRDILMGRTKNAPKHPGNVFYRDIVTKYKQAYKAAAKGDKKLLAANLVNYFRVRNGRFLQEHESTDNDSPSIWYHEVGNAEAIKKLSQSLRGGGWMLNGAAVEKEEEGKILESDKNAKPSSNAPSGTNRDKPNQESDVSAVDHHIEPSNSESPFCLKPDLCKSIETTSIGFPMGAYRARGAISRTAATRPGLPRFPDDTTSTRRESPKYSQDDTIDRKIANSLVLQHTNRFLSTDMRQLRLTFAKEFQQLAEYRATVALTEFLELKANGNDATRKVTPPKPPLAGYRHVMSNSQIETSLTAMLATFALHVESRRASLCGVGYYTIGPCGEEALSAAAHALNPADAVALHYRHVGVNIARQLNKQIEENDTEDVMATLEDILLQRARGYTVSRNDPVTGGVHCSIGSGKLRKGIGGDFIVTSTLASQCCPAVGRALAYSLIDQGKLVDESGNQLRPISFVTLGDGSVHNAHFWSAYHLARHARHKRIKCPVVFGISDNGLSISYKTEGYVNTLFRNDSLVPLFGANGNDMMDVYSATKEATDYSRKHAAPSMIHYTGLVRRFGHAATDRQVAYLEKGDIAAFEKTRLLESAIVQAVEVYNATTYTSVRDLFAELQCMVQNAFDLAVEEPKVDRNDMMARVSAPMVVVPTFPSKMQCVSLDKDSSGKREVMRKHMNRVIMEVMERHDDLVYLGEDCRHGGYYVVTEGIKNRFNNRILDFPPDETSLLGAAAGFAQMGLIPVVEIPYAKYLDCGADMFYEIAAMYWLSAGKCPNGMIIRVQGFDRGLFGGNFHTHNSLQHMPAGVDVLCYSNGEDYVRGFRNAVLQAQAGRVVMLIDCTDLLNRRHLHGTDKGWERVYPNNCGEYAAMGFHEIQRYGTKGIWAMVTYGNGVVTCLQARKALVELKVISCEAELDIIDCPYLSEVPTGLKDIALQYQGLLFADICKDGPGSNVLSNTAVSLHKDGKLPACWMHVAAPRTYNPLGSMATFLNVDDVVSGVHRLLDQANGEKK
ncbi:hypothetical protein MPSEU_000400200 [Mayamaea pseudoterrestris]|nr:hypothetical protein MPSEU_000400200 [Mayamaea pseudoterrestris]